MTRDEAVALIAKRAGNRTDLDDRIVDEINFAQTFALEQKGTFRPWFLETEWATTTSYTPDERISLPPDFLTEIEGQPIWIYDENAEMPYRRLIKAEYDDILVKHQAPGKPVTYALSGNYILLRPIPDAEYVIKTRYYAKQPLMTSGTDANNWLKYAGDVLVAEAGARIAQHLRNPAMLSEFQSDAANAWARLYLFHEARQHVNRDYSMGVD